MITERAQTLLGVSRTARRLDEEITAAARSDAKVLITGESGVGKEVAARLIHERSRRSYRPLVTLNCAGVPEGLLESELFGHVRGSFTGAYRDKAGIFEAAHGGTVFLDEIGEMSLRMQALLLRFLETGEIQRVGSERAAGHVDARVICATNRVLADRIASGDFREDLYYRLNVISLHMPPLRERPDDVPVLLEHFMESFAERHGMPLPVLRADARDRLLAYQWPGNIRELRNVVERLVVRTRNTLIASADLPIEIQNVPRPTPGAAPLSPAETLADMVARTLYGRITERGESFWTVVHDPFMARDLTRDTLRRIVTLGLEQAAGRYSALTEQFRLGKDDYKRLLNFLRKHDCLVPYQAFRPGNQADAATPHTARVA